MFRSRRRRSVSASACGSSILRRAFRPIVEQLEGRLMLAGVIDLAGPKWFDQGPGPVALPSDPNKPVIADQVGAVKAIASPPNDASVVFLGTVNGGVWVSRNANNSSGPPAWEWLTGPDFTGPVQRPLQVDLQSQSIGALALSHY